MGVGVRGLRQGIREGNKGLEGLGVSGEDWGGDRRREGRQGKQ